MIELPMLDGNDRMPLTGLRTKEQYMTDREEYRIVHLSDLHYDGANLDLLAELMSHIVEIGPRFVIVSGDIADGPMDDLTVPAAMLRGALKDIEGFHGFKPVLRVVPGNHDLFYKGTYGLRRTRTFYKAFTPEERGNYVSPDTPVTIATFDSNQLYEPRESSCCASCRTVSSSSATWTPFRSGSRLSSAPWPATRTGDR
jgi:hypothetical protein